MNLNLSFRYQEQNDNKAIVLTDTTDNYNYVKTTTTTGVIANQMYRIANSGSYNFVALGAANNNVGTRFVSNANATIDSGGSVNEVTPATSEIVSATLAVTVVDIFNVTTVKNQVNLYATFGGPFDSQEEMVFIINSAHLGDPPDLLLPDGLYTLTYTLGSRIGGAGAVQTDILTVTILVYGQVKVATYKKLREIPVSYMCNDGRSKSLIAEADLCGAFLTGIENSAYIAKTEELINMLFQLDRIIKNGSNITW